MAKKKRRTAGSSSRDSDADTFPYDHLRYCVVCGNRDTAKLWSRRHISGPPCCAETKIHYHMGCVCGARWIVGAWRKADGVPKWILEILKTDGDRPQPPAAATG